MKAAPGWASSGGCDARTAPAGPSLNLLPHPSQRNTARPTRNSPKPWSLGLGLGKPPWFSMPAGLGAAPQGATSIASASACPSRAAAHSHWTHRWRSACPARSWVTYMSLRKPQPQQGEEVWAHQCPGRMPWPGTLECPSTAGAAQAARINCALKLGMAASAAPQ